MISFALADAENLLDLSLVEADDHLAIDDRDRGCSETQLLQFLQRLLIFEDILCDKFYTPLRKKLFLLVAEASAGLDVDDHLFRHDCSPLPTVEAPKASQRFPARPQMLRASSSKDLQADRWHSTRSPSGPVNRRS